MNQQANVLFLFTDQQRADTIYAPGKPRRLVTPALDALAQESTVLTGSPAFAISPTNWTLCDSPYS